ncbi:hypothetical protein KKH03_01915 [Patescibacteria group bacterium]|nr:hypothetical protein [Patescibacteria group bacterium]
MADFKSQSMSLVEQAENIDKAKMEPINAETRFNHNPDTNISALAEKAYPENKAEQERYKAKIIASLEKYVKGSIDELWQYLESKYCTTTKIVEGILRFFSGDRKEIALTRFLRPPDLSATLPLDDALEQSREATLTGTKAKLAALLDEIRANNPNV